MLIELPILEGTATTPTNHLLQSQHIVDAYSYDGDRTRVKMVNGDLWTVKMTYAAFRQYAFDAQFAYTYNQGTAPA